MRHQTWHEILAMSRYWLAAVAILCLSGVVADAQTDRLEREVKAAAAGHDVRVGTTPIFGRTVPRVRCRRSGW